MADEDKRFHLQLVQDAIARMARNSFWLKNWTVVLVAALFALSARDASASYAWVAFFPVLVFWGLDGFFLATEWQFRKLYDAVRQDEPALSAFSLNVAAVRDNPTTPNLKARQWLRATVSKTLAPFYGVIVAAILVVLVVA